MQSGTLTITGENSTYILLKKRPHSVKVHFKSEHECVPCNPHHHDHFHYEIRHEDERPPQSPPSI